MFTFFLVVGMLAAGAGDLSDIQPDTSGPRATEGDFQNGDDATERMITVRCDGEGQEGCE